MAYLVNNNPDDREILDYDFEGGERVAIDLQSDGRVFPREWVLRGMTLGTCIGLPMRAPEEFNAAVPTRMVINSKEDGYVPDFAPAVEYEANLVIDRFVNLIERLEPNVHQFFPIPKVVDTAGHSIAKRFHLMNVLTRLDAVIEEESDVHWVPVQKDSDQRVLVMKMGLGRKPRLVLRRSVIQGHHVWLGSRGKLTVHRFFSNELHDEIIRAGLSPLVYLKCEEQ